MASSAFAVLVFALATIGASAARPAIHKHDVSELASEAAFNALDTDKDKQISFAEFSAALGVEQSDESTTEACLPGQLCCGGTDCHKVDTTSDRCKKCSCSSGSCVR